MNLLLMEVQVWEGGQVDVRPEINILMLCTSFADKLTLKRRQEISPLNINCLYPLVPSMRF